MTPELADAVEVLQGLHPIREAEAARVIAAIAARRHVPDWPRYLLALTDDEVRRWRKIAYAEYVPDNVIPLTRRQEDTA